MTPHVSHLQDDGSVFPPVTPDPPLPPGQEEIEVPDIVPVTEPDSGTTTTPDSGDTGGSGEQPKGSEPPD